MIMHVDDCFIFGTSIDIIEIFTMSLIRPDQKMKKKHQQFDDGFDFTVKDLIEKVLGVETCQ